MFRSKTFGLLLCVIIREIMIDKVNFVSQVVEAVGFRTSNGWR